MARNSGLCKGTVLKNLTYLAVTTLIVISMLLLMFHFLSMLVSIKIYPTITNRQTQLTPVSSEGKTVKLANVSITAQKMKFSTKDFFSKRNRIRRFLLIT